MIGRLALRLAPLVAGMAGISALYYLFLGGVALRHGDTPFALFYGAYGIAGIALAMALMRVWRQGRRARVPEKRGDG